MLGGIWLTLINPSLHGSLMWWPNGPMQANFQNVMVHVTQDFRLLRDMASLVAALS